MCIFCDKDTTLISATAYADNDDEFSAYVDIKGGKLRIKMIKEAFDSTEDVGFDEMEIDFCPVCGKKLH